MSKNASKVFPWVIVFLSSCFLFYKYIMQVYPSVMTSPLMRAFHVHGFGLGNLAATFFYSYLITQLFVGILLDKYSVRYLSGAAIAISAVGVFLFSMSHNIYAAMGSRMLMGMGAAFATVTYMKLAANWFKPNMFAFVGGLLATAAMLGAIFGEAPLAWLVDHHGWRHALVWCGWLGLIISALFIFVVRDQPKVVINKENENYRVGFKDLVRIATTPQNWLLTFYSGLAFSPVAVFGGLWGNPFIKEAYHFSNTQVASLISLIFFGLAVGGPLLGFISDRLQNRRAVMVFGSSLSLISVVLILYVNALPIWLLVMLLVAFGFGTGSFMLGFAIGKEINPIVLAATIIAFINSGDAIFGALTEPMVGKFLDAGWQHKLAHGVPFFSVHDFRVALTVLPLYLLIALVLVFFIREKQV